MAGASRGSVCWGYTEKLRSSPLLICQFSQFVTDTDLSEKREKRLGLGDRMDSSLGLRSERGRGFGFERRGGRGWWCGFLLREAACTV